MTDEEERNELLAITQKASLNQKTTTDRFAHLESYLSALLYLKNFKDDIPRFRTELQSLSEQDLDTVCANATTKTMPGYFHLLPDEVYRLQTGRKKLLLHERAQLSTFIRTFAGNAWVDLGGVMETRIELDDHSSLERETRPYVRIYYYNEPDLRVARIEKIDILESVRNDATAIAHPAIAFAIRRWQLVIRSQRIFKRKDIYSAENEALKRTKYLLGGERDVDIAKRNLRALGDALLIGAKTGAISREAALLLDVEDLGLDDPQSLLRIAWENLKTARNEPDILGTLEDGLCKAADRIQPWGLLSVAKVMDFLRAREGQRFVVGNEDGNSSRRAWVVFKNAFLGWYRVLKPGSAQQYLEDAKKESIDPEGVYRPSYVRPKTNIISMLKYELTRPLVAAQEPVAEEDMSE